MRFVITPGNKRQEKALRSFLESLDIPYSLEPGEDQGLLVAMQKGRNSKLMSKKEKEVFLRKLKRNG
jgi:hypothetical protein